jgi:hypothetical protein
MMPSDAIVPFRTVLRSRPEAHPLGSVFKAAPRAISGSDQAVRAVGNARGWPAPSRSGASAARLSGSRSGFENRA